MSKAGRVVVFIAGLGAICAGLAYSYAAVMTTGPMTGPKSLAGFLVMLIGDVPGLFMFVVGLFYLARAIKNPSTG